MHKREKVARCMGLYCSKRAGVNTSEGSKNPEPEKRARDDERPQGLSTSIHVHTLYGLTLPQ